MRPCQTSSACSPCPCRFIRFCTVGPLFTVRFLTYLVYWSQACWLWRRYLQVVYLQKCLHQAGKRRLLLVVLWLVAMTLSVPALVVRQSLGFVTFSVVATLNRKVNQAAFFSNCPMDAISYNKAAVVAAISLRRGPVEVLYGQLEHRWSTDICE